MQLWHGSKEKIEKFKGDALTGIVHLGTLDQASMRSGGKHLHLVEIEMAKLRRVRDPGGDMGEIISKSRRSGYDGLVYLNRYEGIRAETLEAALSSHPNTDFDRISDRAFKEIFPEAEMSYLSFDPHHCKITAYFETVEEAREHLNALSNDSTNDNLSP